MSNILITGTSSGIGLELARNLHKKGVRVFATIRKSQDAERLKNEMPNLEPIIMDVAILGSIKAAKLEVSRLLNGETLDAVINNAGVVVSAPLEFIPIEKLREQIEINTIGPIAVTQDFLPLLSHGGRLVFISSISGLVSTPFVGPYCASKFALEALVDSLRMELLPFGVKVSLIEPGTIATPIWEKSVNTNQQLIDGLPPEAYKKYGKIYEWIKGYSVKMAKNASSPESVVHATLKALYSKNPRTRYLVGNDARFQYWLSKLPDKWLDWIYSKALSHFTSKRKVQS